MERRMKILKVLSIKEKGLICGKAEKRKRNS
jgi:hypothetical protein